VLEPTTKLNNGSRREVTVTSERERPTEIGTPQASHGVVELVVELQNGKFENVSLDCYIAVMLHDGL